MNAADPGGIGEPPFDKPKTKPFVCRACLLVCVPSFFACLIHSGLLSASSTGSYYGSRSYTLRAGMHDGRHWPPPCHCLYDVLQKFVHRSSSISARWFEWDKARRCPRNIHWEPRCPKMIVGRRSSVMGDGVMGGPANPIFWMMALDYCQTVLISARLQAGTVTWISKTFSQDYSVGYITLWCISEHIGDVLFTFPITGKRGFFVINFRLRNTHLLQ